MEITLRERERFAEMEKAIPQPIRCRAAVCWAPGEALKIEEVVVAPPRDWEVRIKIICTSLCHSDLTFWRMKDPPAVFPRIFGHEAIGVVESVGDHVKEFVPGDTVIPTFMAQCNECIDCTSQKSNMCSQIPFEVYAGMPRDRTSRFTGSNGETLNHFLSVSSFSEYTVIDMTNLTKLEADMPPEKACLLSCGVSTGLGATWKVAKVEKGSSVAIFGLGAVGLAVAEGARLQGATKIIGVDLNSDKFKIGKKLGLTDFINPKEIGDKTVTEVIHEMTGGGADYCFECIGLASLMKEAFDSSRKGWGKTIILGVEMHGAPLNISPNQILLGKTIMGSLFGGINIKTDIPIFIKQYLDKKLHLDEFITHEVGFEDINKAFDLLVNGESLRCIIWMDR